jgi:flavin reductase (DIM6/NTAB) family NADH-FMN oxidoreductase RutF
MSPDLDASSASSADPDDAYDRLRRRVLWKLPTGLYVVGARDGDRRNGMTLNLAMQVSTSPKLVAIAVRCDAFTHELIAAGGAFSLNVLDRQDRALVRRFVKPVAVDIAAMTMNEVPYFDGSTGVPVLSGALAYVECEVREQVDCGDHSLFVGEVVDAAFLSDESTDVLRMEDTRMNYGG